MAFQQISDRTTHVREKLGKRTDIDTRINLWLGDAYLELGMGFSFEELLSTVDTPTTAGEVEGTDDIYDYPSNTRAIKALTLIRSNDSRQPLIRRSIRLIERYSASTPGPPSIYAPYSVQAATTTTRLIIVRPIPDIVYTPGIRWRIWLKPVLDGTIADTYLRMPDDWLEILDYSAALRGFTELLEHERAAAIFALLNGAEDPRTGKRQPGLIAKRMTAMQAEVGEEEYAIRPRIRKYTH